MRLVLVLALTLGPGLTFAQTAPSENSPSARSAISHSSTNSALQNSVEHLADTNAELLDLLKKQQAVMEDIQFDRRLQSRQIQSLEERLQETLLENAQLQNKIDKLSSAASAAPAPAAPTTAAPQAASTTATGNQPPLTPSAPAPTPTPAPPASYLAAAPPETATGVPTWHRLFALAGGDNRSTDIFNVQGHQWRILWHNQDPDGKAYKNTSALFLNAFPKDDTIPQKVCSQLGSGGGSTMLVGPGNYYVKVEASGGRWELAVEDFH